MTNNSHEGAATIVTNTVELQEYLTDASTLAEETETNAASAVEKDYHIKIMEPDGSYTTMPKGMNNVGELKNSFAIRRSKIGIQTKRLALFLDGEELPDEYNISLINKDNVVAGISKSKEEKAAVSSLRECIDAHKVAQARQAPRGSIEELISRLNNIAAVND